MLLEAVTLLLIVVRWPRVGASLPLVGVALLLVAVGWQRIGVEWVLQSANWPVVGEIQVKRADPELLIQRMIFDSPICHTVRASILGPPRSWTTRAAG